MERIAVLPERERGVCCPPTLRARPEKIEQTSEILKALADPTRLQMMLSLRDAKEPVCICDFTATFDISQPTVSHHMSRLREAGLVSVQRDGQRRRYELRSEPLADVDAWLAPYRRQWASRLDALERHLDEEATR